MLGIRDKHNAVGAKKEKGKGKSSAKDLQRLNRYDLLELLVDQMHEGDELRLTIANAETEIAELTSLADRLKDKLDLKDEQIEHLKEKLNLKDEQIGNLKGKLDDKDELIEKLKRRLDAKDALIAHLSSGEIVDPEVLEVLEARSRAAEVTEAAGAETEPAISDIAEPGSDPEDGASEPEIEL